MSMQGVVGKQARGFGSRLGRGGGVGQVWNRQGVKVAGWMRRGGDRRVWIRPGGGVALGQQVGRLGEQDR